jgi:long-chain fatty acid transport protein
VSATAAKGAVIGADIPIPFGGVLRDRIAAGLAFYTPSDVIVRGRILYPEVPDYALLADRSQSLMIRAGLGVDLPWGLRVGAGFAALAEIDGTVLVATDATGKVGSRVDDQLVATYAPSFGLAWRLPWLRRHPIRVGLSYRGELDARFAVEIDATKLSTLNIPVFNIAGVAQYDPAQWVFEAAWDDDPWVVAAGITYKKWSGYPGPVEPTIRCPSDEPDCGALQPVTLDMHDTVVVRAGAERRFPLADGASGFLRAGAFYEPSPLARSLPASQAFDQPSRMDVSVPTRFFDADRWAVTLGWGVDMAAPLPPITLDAYAQLHVLVPQHVDTPPTSGADLSGHLLAAGLLAGVKF